MQTLSSFFQVAGKPFETVAINVVIFKLMKEEIIVYDISSSNFGVDQWMGGPCGPKTMKSFILNKNLKVTSSSNFVADARLGGGGVCTDPTK